MVAILDISLKGLVYDFESKCHAYFKSLYGEIKPVNDL